MLSLCFYYNSNAVNDLSFVDTKERETVIVAPSPVLADSIRSKVKTGTSVITISKFISEYFEFFKYDMQDRFKSKSDLMKDLLMVWKIVNPDLGYEQFKRSFNLFTDLRSFSVNSEIIGSVLKEYDEVSRKSVAAYYQFLEQQDYVEEHKRYFILSELLREYNVDVIEEKKNIIIMGFTFMSASQIDLIKSLAILHDVYIPFPKEVYEESLDSDWIKWLDETDTSRKVLDEKENSKKLTMHEHPKKGLSHALTSLHSKNKQLEICLLSKNTTASELMAASITNSYFKTPVDLFENRIIENFDEIEEEFYRDITSEVEGIKIIQFLKEKLELALDEKRLLEIKPLTLALSTIDHHINLNQRNEILKLIDLKVLRDVILLDAPRASFAVLNPSESSNKIYDLNSIDEISGHGKILLCMNSDLGSVGSSDKAYTESVETILFEVGPLKRAAFDFLLTKQKIVELLNEKDIELVCESKLLDSDIYLNSVFADFEIEKVKISNESHKKNDKDIIEVTKPEIKNLSATRFQTYLECPRKYYLNSVEKLSIFVDFNSSVQPVDLGRLEHKIIEHYFKATQSWDEKVFKNTVEATLKAFYEKRDLPLQEKLSAEIEVYEYAKNGVDFLLNLMEREPGIKFEFEKPFKKKGELEHIGQADCIGTTANKLFIIDFKRSTGSVPKKTHILNFDKIQTWFYLNVLKEDYNKDEVFVGYVCLAEIPETIFLSNIEDKKYWPEVKFYPVKNFDDVFSEYQALEEEKIKELKNDSIFAIEPRDSKSCGYCDFSNICTKGLV